MERGARVIGCAFVLNLLWISLMPLASEAMLAPADEMIVSSPSGISRTEDLKTVRKVLEQKIIQQRLQDIGLTQEEINSRLDRLSDGQLHLMAMQVNALIPAGDDGTVWTIVGILLIILLVIVILAILL